MFGFPEFFGGPGGFRKVRDADSKKTSANFVEIRPMVPSVICYDASSPHSHEHVRFYPPLSPDIGKRGKTLGIIARRVVKPDVRLEFPRISYFSLWFLIFSIILLYFPRFSYFWTPSHGIFDRARARKIDRTLSEQKLATGLFAFRVCGKTMKNKEKTKKHNEKTQKIKKNNEKQRNIQKNKETYTNDKIATPKRNKTKNIKNNKTIRTRTGHWKATRRALGPVLIQNLGWATRACRNSRKIRRKYKNTLYTKRIKIIGYAIFLYVLYIYIYVFLLLYFCMFLLFLQARVAQPSTKSYTQIRRSKRGYMISKIILEGPYKPRRYQASGSFSGKMKNK